MDVHAAYYAHSKGLFSGDDKPVIAKKKKVRFIDLIRPDFYLNFNVDQMVGILIWLKKEIQRVTKYSGRCDSFYRCGEDTYLVGADYLEKIREVMSRIFLSRANGLGRWTFDKLYDLDTVKILPISYYVTHIPLKWGKSQLDLLKEVTENDTQSLKNIPRITTWSPNSCHKRARTIHGRYLVIQKDGFWYKISYGYLNEGGWNIIIEPQEDQTVIDFLLDLKQLFGLGLKRKYLKSKNGCKYSSWYRINTVALKESNDSEASVA